MLDHETCLKLSALWEKADVLEFNKSNTDELFRLISEAEKMIESAGSKDRKKCISEFEKIRKQEFASLKRNPGEDTFSSAKEELKYVLKDLISGQIFVEQ